MTWQPIETAPKDGTHFLAFDSRVRRMGVCHMVNISTREPLWVCQLLECDFEYGPGVEDFGRDYSDITHWQPLPEPPTSYTHDKKS